MNNTRPLLALAAFLGAAVHAQTPLSEQALQQSGVTENVGAAVQVPGDTLASSAAPADTLAPSAAPADTLAPSVAPADTLAPSVAPVDSASSAAASVLVQPLPATPAAAPTADPVAARSRIRLLAGATDWHWEESDAEGEILLVEGGWFPGMRFEFARLTQRGTFGASVDAGAGAIEYDGGIQNSLTGEIIPFKSYTHYAQATIDLFYFFPIFKGRIPVDIGVRGGVHHWVRTIDSKKMEDPGEYGYVETWSHMSVQPAVAVEVPFGSSSSFRLEGGMRFGFSAEERITELGDGDIKPLLKPKPTPAIRGNALLKVRHLLLEAEYLGLDFDKSRLWRGAIYQPDSYLDRLDVRVGWEF